MSRVTRQLNLKMKMNNIMLENYAYAAEACAVDQAKLDTMNSNLEIIRVLCNWAKHSNNGQVCFKFNSQDYVHDVLVVLILFLKLLTNGDDIAARLPATTSKRGGTALRLAHFFTDAHRELNARYPGINAVKKFKKGEIVLCNKQNVTQDNDARAVRKDLAEDFCDIVAQLLQSIH